MTPIQLVYDSFLSYIDDIELLNPYSDESYEEFKERLSTYLEITFKSSLPKIFGMRHNLTLDSTGCFFVEDLTYAEIEVIGLTMLKEYYRSKMNFTVSLKHNYSDKFWKSHDKTSMINQYRQLLKETDKEIRQLVSDLSYNEDGKFAGWWENNG